MWTLKENGNVWQSIRSMDGKKKIYLKWGLALGSFWCFGEARADFYIHHWENRHQARYPFTLSPMVRYVDSTTNFNAESRRSTPLSLDYYRRLQTDLDLDFQALKGLTVYGRFTWTALEVKTVEASGASHIFGFSDQTLGANYRLAEAGSGVTFDLQTQGDFHLYSNQAAFDNGLPFLGDGTVDLTTGFFIGIPLDSPDVKRLLITLGAGYTWRSRGFSMALPWSIDFQVRPSEASGLYLKTGFYGLQSIKTDDRISEQALGSGGSYFSYARNPSLISFQAQSGYQFNDKLGIGLNGSQGIHGNSAPQAWTIGAHFRFLFGSPKVDRESSTLTPTEYAKSNRGFVAYHFQGTISRVNDRLNLLRIDRGSDHGVREGQILDVFSLNPDGTVREAVARIQVSDVKSEESAAKIVEYFREVWIEEGFIVRSPLK
jgi:hypothetical protein